MVMDSPMPGSASPAGRCVFVKALLGRRATCECASRQAQGEQLFVVCTSAVARTNCSTFSALLHERARFPLHLPAPGQPLLHAQALRLQCGALAALKGVLGATGDDAHQHVMLAQQRHGSLTELPWAELVAAVVAWQPPPRRQPAR
jgi:hypothetical protein